MSLTPILDQWFKRDLPEYKDLVKKKLEKESNRITSEELELYRDESEGANISQIAEMMHYMIYDIHHLNRQWTTIQYIQYFRNLSHRHVFEELTLRYLEKYWFQFYSPKLKKIIELNLNQQTEQEKQQKYKEIINKLSFVDSIQYGYMKESIQQYNKDKLVDLIGRVILLPIQISTTSNVVRLYTNRNNHIHLPSWFLGSEFSIVLSNFQIQLLKDIELVPKKVQPPVQWTFLPLQSEIIEKSFKPVSFSNIYQDVMTNRFNPMIAEYLADLQVDLQSLSIAELKEKLSRREDDDEKKHDITLDEFKKERNQTLLIQFQLHVTHCMAKNCERLFEVSDPIPKALIQFKEWYKEQFMSCYDDLQRKTLDKTNELNDSRDTIVRNACEKDLHVYRDTLMTEMMTIINNRGTFLFPIADTKKREQLKALIEKKIDEEKIYPYHMNQLIHLEKTSNLPPTDEIDFFMKSDEVINNIQYINKIQSIVTDWLTNLNEKTEKKRLELELQFLNETTKPDFVLPLIKLDEEEQKQPKSKKRKLEKEEEVDPKDRDIIQKLIHSIENIWDINNLIEFFITELQQEKSLERRTTFIKILRAVKSPPETPPGGGVSAHQIRQFIKLILLLYDSSGLKIITFS